VSWSVLEALRSKPELVRSSLKKRGLDESLVDKFLELDLKWRKLKGEVDRLRHKYNLLSKELAKSPSKEAVEEARRLWKEVEALERELREVEERRSELLWSFPNIVHESVPECPPDVDGVPVKYWGIPKVWREHLGQFTSDNPGIPYEVIDWRPVGHADLLEHVLELGDTKKAGEVAGSRFYYIFEDIVWLDFALAMYALEYLAERGFKVLIPPYMLRYDVVKGVLDLDTFKDAIYKIEGEDLYLIATSEHSIAAYLYKSEVLESQLPILIAGWSPCFRKEAGAGSRDLKGIFRVHQFHKVEQFVFCKPEESWEWLERLIQYAEELWRGLGVPYRVVNICAHSLGAPAAKKYDLEAWMPAQGKYREMVSASNVTDWQSWRLGIRLIRGGRRELVHTLNSTAIATTRAITAILENFQEPDGTVKIPKILRKYLEPISVAPKDEIRPRKMPSTP